jgi:hypothetical protein
VKCIVGRLINAVVVRDEAAADSGGECAAGGALTAGEDPAHRGDQRGMPPRSTAGADELK